MIARDETTFTWCIENDLLGAPRGEELENAIAHPRGVATDDGAGCDREVSTGASRISLRVAWGTNPEMVHGAADRVPATEELDSPADQESTEPCARLHQDLQPGRPIEQIALERVFIGWCKNSRIGDLRAAAEIVQIHSPAWRALRLDLEPKLRGTPAVAAVRISSLHMDAAAAIARRIRNWT